MSLRASTSAIAGPTEVLSDFWVRFVRDAHVLIAEGYGRLDPATLSKVDEETISGRIRSGVEEWYDAIGRPDWTRSYSVGVEDPERTSVREGKKRPRIDIRVESSAGAGRPPRFAFEAKRFYRSDSVAEYVGTEGLGGFLDGTYVPEAPAAAMLGFLQRGANDDAPEKVHHKLTSERLQHGLSTSGAVWTDVTFDARLGTTRVSIHQRQSPLKAIQIYHSFLRCRP